MRPPIPSSLQLHPKKTQLPFGGMFLMMMLGLGVGSYGILRYREEEIRQYQEQVSCMINVLSSAVQVYTQ
jgi:hypothetical protein